MEVGQQQWWSVSCGRGMERFAALEVADKLHPRTIHPTDGKLHFLLTSASSSSSSSSSTSPSSSSSSVASSSSSSCSSTCPLPLDSTSSSTSSSSSPSASRILHVATTTDEKTRLRTLKSAERLFVQVLAHFQHNPLQCDEGRPTGANPFDIYEKGGLFVMVGWAVGYTQLWEHALYALRWVEDADPAEPVRFRVSAKVRGSWAHSHTAQEVARLFATRIKLKLGWQVDLRNYNTEVMVHLNDEQLVVAFPVGRIPISKRTYMASFGLRPPVAWAMARHAEIKEGEVVCDPMCGVGTLLIEAAQEWPNACYLGADASGEQLEVCSTNLQQSGMISRIGIYQARVEALPLRSSSLDVVLCDLPFGRKHQALGVDMGLEKLYRLMARELLRVLRSHGRAVLLTSQTNILQDAMSATSHRKDEGDDEEEVPQLYRWRMSKEPHYVKLGALDAWIHHYTKEAWCMPASAGELQHRREEKNTNEADTRPSKKKKRKRDEEKPKEKEEKGKEKDKTEMKEKKRRRRKEKDDQEEEDRKGDR